MNTNINFTKYDIKGIPVYIYKTNRFSTIKMDMIFLNDYKRDEISLYNVLLSCLSNTTKKYNTKKKKTIVLDELYSARISFDSVNIYEKRITTASLEMIDPSYITNKDKDYVKESINVLHEFLFNPNVKNNAFIKKEVDEKRYELYQYIKSLDDDKNYLAMKKWVNAFAKDEIFSAPLSGKLEDIDKINEKDVYKIYKDLLEKSEKVIFIIGDFDINKYQNTLLDFIPNGLTNIECNAKIYKDKVELKDEIKEFKEEDIDIKQAKLNIGLRFNIDEKDSYKIVIFNMIFGELFNSSLMNTIRNEKSLAYFIYSMLYYEHRIIQISSEINKDKYDEVIKSIKNILNDYNKGLIDDNLINLAKKKIHDGAKAIYDTPQSIMNTFESNYIRKRMKIFELGLDDYLEMRLKNYDEITKEDIMNISNNIMIDTIFLLYNKE